MTVYSYWKAKKHREQFEEPVLLGKLVRRTIPQKITPQSSNIAGWIIHYTIGGLFNVAYDQLWKKSSLKPGAVNGFLLGAPSGLLGMAAWAILLHVHSNPPHTHLEKHLKQLFTAHLIFGISSAMTYRLLQKSKNRMKE